MKSLIKNLKKRLVLWVKRMSLEERLAFALAMLLSTIIGATAFIITDKVPATELDYSKLENQAIAVQKNPELLLNTNSEINVKDGTISVKFENTECAIEVQYNQNYEILSIAKKDKATFWLYALLIAMIVFIFSMAWLSLMLFIAVVAIKKLGKWILEKF